MGTDFNPKIFNSAVKLLNKVEADLNFISGDLTTDGLLREYKFAQEKLDQIDGKLVIVPGNHDERNLGWKLFPEFFGDTDFINNYDNLTLVGLASSEPDKDNGRLGRGRHKKIVDGINKKNDCSK
jgi:3',5'-cyclic AMP phosphodiesterase CpdA